MVDLIGLPYGPRALDPGVPDIPIASGYFRLGEQVTMPDSTDTTERIHALETAQAVQTAVQSGADATQAATQAGATATNAATHAGTWSTMAAGAAGLFSGMFLGMTIGRK